jgi:hypothetical protein
LDYEGKDPIGFFVYNGRSMPRTMLSLVWRTSVPGFLYCYTKR